MSRQPPTEQPPPASEWRVDLSGSPAGALRAASEMLLASGECAVERMTKNGLRTFDVRGAVLMLNVVDDDTFLLRSLQQSPLVRLDDVMTALRRFDDRLISPPMLTRLRQGPLREDGIADPLTGE